MAPNDSAQQRTEKPTQRRRERARSEGMVALSQEVNNTLALLAAVGAMALFSSSTIQTIAANMADRLGTLDAPEISIAGVRGLVCDSVRVAATAVVPLMLLTGLVGLLACVAQTGILVTPKRLAPNLKQMNPIKGLKRMVSLGALVRLIVALFKLGAIGAIVYLFVRSRLVGFFALVGKSTWGVLESGRRTCLDLLFRIAAAMIVVAVLDYAYQRYRFEKQLMMTKSELKQEHRRDEGDPQVKGRQEQIRRAMSRSRMMQAVPEADVVVTNPTHLAIALRWDPETMAAPQVVAKGRDWMARRIKQIAQNHGVPVLERKVLAQALYEAVEVGMPIPAKLYYAVAKVLAFVMKKRSA